MSAPEMTIWVSLPELNITINTKKECSSEEQLSRHGRIPGQSLRIELSRLACNGGGQLGALQHDDQLESEIWVAGMNMPILLQRP